MRLPGRCQTASKRELAACVHSVGYVKWPLCCTHDIKKQIQKEIARPLRGRENPSAGVIDGPVARALFIYISASCVNIDKHQGYCYIVSRRSHSPPSDCLAFFFPRWLLFPVLLLILHTRAPWALLYSGARRGTDGNRGHTCVFVFRSTTTQQYTRIPNASYGQLPTAIESRRNPVHLPDPATILPKGHRGAAQTRRKSDGDSASPFAYFFLALSPLPFFLVCIIFLLGYRPSGTKVYFPVCRRFRGPGTPSQCLHGMAAFANSITQFYRMVELSPAVRVT